MMGRVAIIGGGAWGTALALAARRAGRDVLIWAHGADTVRAINDKHLNATFLPGVALDPDIRATGDLAEAAAHQLVLLVVPSAHLRTIAHQLSPSLPPRAIACVCTKGIELATGDLMTEIAAEELPNARIAALSGPSFAADVARDLPTAVTVAGADDVSTEVANALASPCFRIYRSDDLNGIEIGGAVKNVLAIACGIAMGRQLGDNARAALISRGLAEMVRLGLALGGRQETLMGLSGLGDLVLTCTGEKSRNYSLGLALGRGESLDTIMGGRRSVAEGAVTAPAVVALAKRLGLDLPICTAVDHVLAGRQSVDQAIQSLLMRPAGSEFQTSTAS